MTAGFIIFGLNLAFVVYILLGYPVLLALTARRRQAAVETREDRLESVTVLLPVKNGEQWIRRKLESLRAVDYPRELLQIIVISDGSIDRTEKIAREFPEVELIRVPSGGKALAINAGLQGARNDLLFFTDVRQEMDPACLKHLVRRFADPAVGVASGELMIRQGDKAEEESVGLYWRYEKWIRRRHSGIDSVLGATGAIYMMRRALASPLPPGTLLDDVHLPFQAFFRGYRLLFVEEARAYDVPTDLSAEFRRKVRTLAGVYQLIAAFPALLGPRNRMWIHFLSHKFGRMLLPFALLAMFASSWFLWMPWSAMAAGGQILFYALAALDPYVPDRNPLKRLSSVIRTFVVLMIATLLAASILFRPSASFWSAPAQGKATNA